LETRPAPALEMTAGPAPAGMGNVCGPGYERHGAANNAGPDDNEAAIIMEHLCAPFRRQHAGSRESLSDANRKGTISEAQNSASNTAAVLARAARQYSADVFSPPTREYSGHLAYTLKIVKDET
jgi:hypothetical protein